MKRSKLLIGTLLLTLTFTAVPQTNAFAPAVAAAFGSAGVRALIQAAFTKFVEGAGSGLGVALITELLGGNQVAVTPQQAPVVRAGMGLLASANVEKFDQIGRKVETMTTAPQGAILTEDHQAVQKVFLSDSICNAPTSLEIHYSVGSLPGAGSAFGGLPRDAYHVEIQEVTIDRGTLSPGCQAVAQIKFFRRMKDNIFSLEYFVEWAHVRYDGRTMQVSQGNRSKGNIGPFGAY